MKTHLRHLILRLFSLTLVGALLAAGLPAPVQAASPASNAHVTCAQNYTVKAGDTLTSIAATYGVTVTELANANNLKEPYLIYVGQVLCIPASASSTTTSGSTTTSSSAEKLIIERGKNTVVIKITGFPKKSIYYVKGKNAARGVYPWYKFGRVKTSKTGSATITLKLPKQLRSTEVIQVCLKNAVTDAVVCQTVR